MAASDNTVYVVTRGEGDDYTILGAFSSFILAAAFRDRCRSSLASGGRIDHLAVEAYTVDEYVDRDGQFWVRVGTIRDEIVAWGYDPTGDPERPADTADAVELDGVPQHFTGYGRNLEAAHAQAIAFRDSARVAHR